MKLGKAPTDGIRGRRYPFTVTISPEDFHRMNIWCRLSSPNEVGGVALVIDDGNTLHINKPQLLTQKVSGGEVDLAADEVLAWLINQFKAENINCAMPNATFCFWHSHPTFNTFFSGQDERWINTYVNRGYLVSLCVNNSKEHNIRVDTLVGGTNQKTALWQHYEAKLDILYTVDYAGLDAECKKSFDTHVKPAYKPFKVGGKGKRWNKQFRNNLGFAPGSYNNNYTNNYQPTEPPAGLTVLGDDEWIDWFTNKRYEAVTPVNQDTPPDNDQGPLDLTLLVDEDSGLFMVNDGTEHPAELDPCEYREFLTEYEDHPETPLLLKSLRESEIKNLKAIRKGFCQAGSVPVTVTFNDSGSITIIQGKSSRTLSPTKACLSLVSRRLGVGRGWVKDKLRSGMTVRTDGASNPATKDKNLPPYTPGKVPPNAN